MLVAGNHASIHPRFQGQVEWLSLRRPVFEKPWAFLLSVFSDVHQMPQNSISWRCLSQDGDVFSFLGISGLNQKSIYTSESYIFNKNHLTLFLADSMSFIFKMLFFCGVPSILLLLDPFGGISIFKTLPGSPIRKMRMGTEGFTRCKPQPGEKSLLPKLTKRFQKGNWRLATRQMRV